MRVFRLRYLAVLLLCEMGSIVGFGQGTPAAGNPAAAPAAPAGQTVAPDSRDLKPIQTKQSVAVTIPRSYALVVGISAYKNLPKSAELEFPNRDAEDIYAALITPEADRQQVTAALVYLGRAQSALYEDDKAIASLKQAVDLDPDSQEARASYAAVLLDGEILTRL